MLGPCCWLILHMEYIMSIQTNLVLITPFFLLKDHVVIVHTIYLKQTLV